MKNKQIKLIVAVVILMATPLLVGATTSGEVIVSPQNKGVYIDKIFMDYKYFNNPTPSDAELDEIFILDGLNGIRTPIWGNLGQPAHPANGVVMASYYDPHAEVILRAKQRNPDLIIFASKKLKGQDSYPSWTKTESGVIPVQYAALLADYIEHMNARGIEIDVLGIDNESELNEGNITPVRHKEIVDELNALAGARGFSMPLIVGYEDFGPNKNNWMADLMTHGWGDRMDIYGTHYYPEWRPVTRLQADLAWAGTREKWGTEMHWGANPRVDDWVEAEQGISALWDCTDNGMNCLIWWDYKRTGFRGSMLNNFTIPLLGAYVLSVDDGDGADIASHGKLQTRAFLKGNQMTIYALNVTDTASYSNQLFRIDAGHIEGEVSVMQWTDLNQTNGTPATVIPADAQTFTFDLPTYSITSFSFSYASDLPMAQYAFEGDAHDAGPQVRHGSEVGPVEYPRSRNGFALAGQVEVPVGPFFDFAATCWFKAESESGSLFAGSNVAVDFSGTHLVFSIDTTAITSVKPLHDGRWHQVAVERRGALGEMRLYVDGRLEAIGSGAFTALTGTNLLIGSSAGLLDDVHFYDRLLTPAEIKRSANPSVALAVGGPATERGPVNSQVIISSVATAGDYPYIDLVEDDGSWLPGYSGTTKRNMTTETTSNPELLPKTGFNYFKTTTGGWWRGVCKPQFDNLLVEAGTYSIHFFLGDADSKAPFMSTLSAAFSGNHIGLTATDPLAPVLPQMGGTVSALLHTLDANVVVNLSASAVPSDGEWVEWSMDYTVPTHSPMIGRALGFLFRKPSAANPQTTAAFDGPLIIDFIPAGSVEVPSLLVDYALNGSTATPVDDYDALPVQLTLGIHTIMPVADLMAEGPEQISVTLEPSPTYTISGSGSGTVAIIDHPMDAWRAVQFGADSTNSALAGDHANPDGDALDNVAEWALVTNPTQFDRPNLNPSTDEVYLSIQYNQRINSGYSMGSSWSTSLINPDWRTDEMIVIPGGHTGDVESITVRVPLDTTNKFIRLQFNQ